MMRSQEEKGTKEGLTSSNKRGIFFRSDWKYFKETILLLVFIDYNGNILKKLFLVFIENSGSWMI